MQVRSHGHQEIEREELTENCTTMEADAGSEVPVVQPMEEIGESGASPILNKGSCSAYILGLTAVH